PISSESTTASLTRPRRQFLPRSSPAAMKHMRVVERPVAVAESRRGLDRVLDVAARALHRERQWHGLRERDRDRRGEGAAGAVGVLGLDARAGENLDAAWRREHVVHEPPVEMPALE